MAKSKTKSKPKTPVPNAVQNPFALQRWTNQTAPTSQPFTSGYDAQVGALDLRISKLETLANGAFSDTKHYMPLFINSLTIDLGLYGITAQSQFTRDFYPHNLIMPNFVLTGQCYNQGYYGQLCEYVHAMQRQSLINNSGGLIQFLLRGNSYPTVNGSSTSGLAVKVTKGNTNQVLYNQSIKGQYSPIVCKGHIMSVPREHKQGDYAPRWTMSFMVVQMITSPLYKDRNVKDVQTASWFDLLAGSKAERLDTKANIKENAAVLKYAAANQGRSIATQAP